MTPVRIEAIELLRLELALLAPFSTSTGTLPCRPVVLVRVATDLGEGTGECPALPEPTYTEEYANGAEAVLADQLIPRLLSPTEAAKTADLGAGYGAERRAGSIFSEAAADAVVGRLLTRLDPVRGHPMAKSALEMALLDAALRAEGRSLADWLGATRRRVPAGATIGLQVSPHELLEAATGATRAGYRRLKLKIAPGRDVAEVRILRQSFPDVALVADANGAYRRDDPEHRLALRALDELGLAAIEQPLAPEDLVGHAALAEGLATTVLLDESIPTSASLEAALAVGFRGAVSVKPARLGGLRVARAMVERCGQAGLGASIGGMLESGIGRRAALALGALDAFDLPGELCPTSRYLAEDLVEPLRLEKEDLVVPDGTGIGVVPDPDRLAELTVRKRTWRAE